MKSARLLLAWYFMVAASTGSGVVVTTNGPFRDQAECEHARSWVMNWGRSNYGTHVSWCWWDGR